jgi:diaminopimelate epimerase
VNTIPFCKFHGFGNDYIVIERSRTHGADLSALAIAICHRHTGAGADGIAVIEKLDSRDADFFCEIVNPDGSIAGFSGNGTRCAVAYIHFAGLSNEADLRLSTRSGVKRFRLIRAGDAAYRFEAEIGVPQFAADKVPVAAANNEDKIIDQPVEINGIELLFSAVNVGNPVACIFVEDLDELDWRVLGKQLETHPIFPERANIVFVKVLDQSNIELRIWERGAGETAASGTCASGAAVLSAARGATGRQVSVHSPGGTTEVLWDERDELILTGDAELAYCGEFRFS